MILLLDFQGSYTVLPCILSDQDTVSEIAERYNVSSAEIRRANKLSNDRIRVGQTLSIPIFAGG